MVEDTAGPKDEDQPWDYSKQTQHGDPEDLEPEGKALHNNSKTTKRTLAKADPPGPKKTKWQGRGKESTAHTKQVHQAIQKGKTDPDNFSSSMLANEIAQALINKITGGDP